MTVQVFGLLLLKGSRRERRENRLSIIVRVLVRIVFNNHYSLKSRKFIILPLLTKIKKNIRLRVYTQEVISKNRQTKRGLLKLMQSLIAKDMT